MIFKNTKITKTIFDFLNEKKLFLTALSILLLSFIAFTNGDLALSLSIFGAFIAFLGFEIFRKKQNQKKSDFDLQNLKKLKVMDWLKIAVLFAFTTFYLYYPMTDKEQMGVALVILLVATPIYLIRKIVKNYKNNKKLLSDLASFDQGHK